MRADLDEARRLVRYTRSSLPFDDLRALDDAYGGLVRAATGLERKGELALLIDLRAGPARNDPVFEQAVARYRGPMMRGFGRVALLVKTAVGRLQVGRHAREDGVVGLVTQDEDEALRFLLGG